MNQIVVQASIRSKKFGNCCNVFISTSMQTVENTIMSTEMADGALQMVFVKNPMFAMSIQKFSEYI